VFKEQVSARGARPRFDECLRALRKGDTLIVTKLDRLARSTADLLDIVDRVKAAGAALKILSGGAAMDTSTAQGRLMLTVIGAIAEFERDLMKERQLVGIAEAKAAGKYTGRKPAVDKRACAFKMLREGVEKATIARKLGVDRVTIYRWSKEG
jgi:DNA invertase Pin-like site-specific DNA recombinase